MAGKKHVYCRKHRYKSFNIAFEDMYSDKISKLMRTYTKDSLNILSALH